MARQRHRSAAHLSTYFSIFLFLSTAWSFRAVLFIPSAGEPDPPEPQKKAPPTKHPNPFPVPAREEARRVCSGFRKKSPGLNRALYPGHAKNRRPLRSAVFVKNLLIYTIRNFPNSGSSRNFV